MRHLVPVPVLAQAVDRVDDALVVCMPAILPGLEDLGARQAFAGGALPCASRIAGDGSCMKLK